MPSAATRGRPPDHASLVALLVVSLVGALASENITSPDPVPISGKRSRDVSLQKVATLFRHLGSLRLTQSYGHICTRVEIKGDIDTYNDVVILAQNTLSSIRRDEALWSTSRGRIDAIFRSFEVRLSYLEGVLRSACLLLSCKLTILRASFPRPPGSVNAKESAAHMPRASHYFRTKRQGAFLAGLSLASVGLSLFSQYELEKLRLHVAHIEHRSEIIASSLNQSISVTNLNTRHIDVLKSEFNKMVDHHKYIAFLASANLIISHLGAILDNLSEHVDNVFKILVHRQVNPIFFGGEVIKEALSDIRSQAGLYNLEPATETVASLLNFHLSFVLSGAGQGAADVFIHVPLVSKTTLSVYMHINVPLITTSGLGLVLDERDDVFATNTIQSQFVTMTSHELSACDRHEAMYLCPIATTRTQVLSSCLGSLFVGSSKGAGAFCNFKAEKITGEIIYEIGTSTILIRAPPSLSLSIKVDCSNVPDAENSHFVVEHERIVKVPRGCIVHGPTSSYQGGPGTLIYNSIRRAEISLADIEENVNSFPSFPRPNDTTSLQWSVPEIPPLQASSNRDTADSFTLAFLACVGSLALISVVLLVLLALWSRRQLRGPRQHLVALPTSRSNATAWQRCFDFKRGTSSQDGQSPWAPSAPPSATSGSQESSAPSTDTCKGEEVAATVSSESHPALSPTG